MQRSILVFAPTELIFSVSLVEAEPAATWVCLGCYSVPGTLSLGGYGFGGIIKECAAQPWLVFLLFAGEKSSKRHEGWGGMDGPSWEGLSVIVFHLLWLREKIPTVTVPAIFSFVLGSCVLLVWQH